MTRIPATDDENEAYAIYAAAADRRHLAAEIDAATKSATKAATGDHSMEPSLALIANANARAARRAISGGVESTDAEVAHSVAYTSF